MTELDGSGWIQTFNGHQVWPFIPEDSRNVFDIEDIAHALAHVCRFSGHVRKFYSVAEHSVLGSRLVHEDFAIHFLLHDASEAYLGDVSRPVKTSMYYGSTSTNACMPLRYKENRLLEAIYRGLGIRLPGEECRAAVKKTDNAMLVREARDLFKTGQREEWAMHAARGWTAAEIELHCWPPEIAERKFLDRFVELVGCGR